MFVSFEFSCIIILAIFDLLEVFNLFILFSLLLFNSSSVIVFVFIKFCFDTDNVDTFLFLFTFHGFFLFVNSKGIAAGFEFSSFFS